MDFVAPESDPRTVVVAQLAFIGDMVFATPLIDALRALWPAAELVVTGRPDALEVLEDHPARLLRVPYDKRGSAKGAGGAFAVGAALRARRPDVFIGVSRSARTAWLARLSGARLRVGFAGPGRRLAYHRVVTRDDTLPMPARPLELLRALGETPVRRPLRLGVSGARRAEAAVRLAAAGRAGAEPVVAIAPGAHYATKRWPEEHVAALLDLLAPSTGMRPALYGGPGEAALIGRLLAGRAHVLDRRGLSVRDMNAELAEAAAFVGGDSGPAHIARALGVPSVVLYGPTPLAAPDDGRPYAALSLGLPCQPCSPHGDAVCPLGHHRCLRDMEPSRVMDAVRSAVKGRT